MNAQRRILLLISILAIPALTALPGRAAGPDLLINEVLASSSHQTQDTRDNFGEWIELYNAGDTAFNAAGLYVTDDKGTPTKWRIPADRPTVTTIPAHGYLVIWTDRNTADAGLHASFRLDADGDEVALFAADGTTLIDYIAFGPQTPDVSYGRDPSADNEWRFFATPTPSGPNAKAYVGAVADPQFSHERGFYSEPITVALTSKTPAATIIYTVDGSEPFDSQRGMILGQEYTGPLVLTTTTTLRAMAFRPGWMPTKTYTHTYLFLDDVIRQATDPVTGAQVVPPGYPATWPGGSTSGPVTGDYQMDPDVVGQNGKDKFGGLYAKTIKDDLKAVPTVSFVMSRDDWFGPTGIYVNESQDGHERVCSLEWIEPNGPGGFQVNCAIATQGGISGGGTSLDRWKTFKLSLRPRFKTTTDDGRPTGGPSQLHYRVFPDSPIEDFDTFVFDEVLSNAFNHSSQHMYPTYLQDQFVSDLHNALGGQSPHGRYVHLYINGLYWGMYYLHERPDHAWAAQMFGGDKEQYDALKHYTSMAVNDGLGGTAVANFSAMVRAADAVAGDSANAAKYDALCRMLDIDNFITDLLAHWFAVNWDWPEKNWYATHRSPDGLWRFHTWDAEHSLEYWNNQNTLGLSVANLHDKLKNNPDYRMHFADIVYRSFFNGGPLSLPTVTDAYRARMAQIDRAIVGESARWGDTRQSNPHTRQDWVTIQDRILSQFLQPRPAFVLNWLKNAGLYPNVDPPALQINGVSQRGGHVATGAALSLPASAPVWYTLDGTDPRVPGTPAGVSTASTQIALVAESAAKRVLVPTGAISDTWRTDVTFNDSSWISGAGGVGYERTTGYEKLFSINVQSQMYGKATTCYIRIPFTITAEVLPTLTSLVLRARYDDAFVAYLNGMEVQRDNFTGTPAWNSVAPGRPDADAKVLKAFDLTSQLSRLHAGTNLLAIQALNDSTTSSDFLFAVELSADKADTSTSTANIPTTAAAARYTAPVALTQSTRVKARVLSGSTWSALNEAVFAVGPVAESLRVSELMYHPADPNCEFIELTNIANQSINLNLVRFTKGIDYTFPSFDLPAGGYCVIVQDPAAFQARYGSRLPVVGQYTGSLNNGGERLELVDAAGQVIQSFDYKDGWFDLADGLGFSLTVKDPKTSDANSLNDKSAWCPSTASGGFPGRSDPGRVLAPGSVVINEVLANSQGVGPDWIELFNTTDQAIDLGGWFLSDDANDLTKYEIAAGTSIPAGGYVVFYEDKHFGNEADPGCKTAFGLGKDGETVYLHSGSAGLLTGYSAQEKFDAADAGVTLGRYAKSTGAFNFVPLSVPTPGKANAAPVVGPVVITEIMYHPAGAPDAEYVEMLNISASAVTLYDAVQQAPWRFTDDPENPSIELLFPTDRPVTLAPGEYLILAKDADMVRSTYSVPANVKVLAWGPGNLADDGEKIQLSRPGDQDDKGNRAWLRVDRVVYSDGLHPGSPAEGPDAWPPEAGGVGKALGRINPQTYGNDPANWRAVAPTPGR